MSLRRVTRVDRSLRSLQRCGVVCRRLGGDAGSGTLAGSLGRSAPGISHVVGLHRVAKCFSTGGARSMEQRVDYRLAGRPVYICFGVGNVSDPKPSDRNRNHRSHPPTATSMEHSTMAVIDVCGRSLHSIASVWRPVVLGPRRGRNTRQSSWPASS